MDRFILDHAQREPGARRAAAQHPARRSGRAAVRRVLRRSRRRICRRASRRSSATSRRPASAAAGGARSTPADQARIWSFREASLGLSMAMKGDDKSLSFVEDTAVAPEKLRDYIERFLADRPRPRHGRRRLRARVGRLPARAAGRQPEDRRGRRRRSRRSRNDDRRSGARVRRRAVGRTRRRPGARPVHREDVRPGALRRVPHGQADVRSRRPVQSRQDRRLAAADVEPALRRRLPDAGSADVLRLRRARRHRPRRRDVQRPRRLPQDAGRHDVPVVHGDARGEALDARAREHAAAGDGGPAGRRRAERRRTSTTSSISASSAAPARPSARSASTSRGSRASSSPATGSATARRSNTRVIGHVHTARRNGAAASRRSSNSIAAQRARPVDQRAAARHRSPADAAGLGAARRSRRGSRAVGASRQSPSATSRQPPRVVLFNDTFTNFYHPEIGDGRRRRARAGGVGVRLAPHGCCGRPLISQGLLGRGARARRRRTSTRCSTPPRAASGSCFSSRAACRRSARTRRRCCAARLQRKAPRGRRRVRAVRGVLEQEWAGRPGARCICRPDRRRCCFTATVIRRRWVCCRRRGRCWRGFRAAPSSISTPAAAAWPGRSATPGSTTTCRAQIGERKLLPAARAMSAGGVLVASGHVVPRAGRALHRREGAAPGRTVGVVGVAGLKRRASIATLAGATIRSERVHPGRVLRRELADLVERLQVVRRQRDVDRLQVVVELRDLSARR